VSIKKLVQQKGAISFFTLLVFSGIILINITTQSINNYYQKKLQAQLCTDLTALYIAAQIGQIDNQQLYSKALDLHESNCHTPQPNITINQGFWNQKNKKFIANNSKKKFVDSNSPLSNAIQVIYTQPSFIILKKIFNIDIQITSISVAINPNAKQSMSSYLLK
jgi:hypothetical protein